VERRRKSLRLFDLRQHHELPDARHRAVDGNDLVNSWEQKIDGKPAKFTGSFVDITPDSFRLISQGTSGGKIIWRVITQYVRARS
jgi:hypothetical protein